MKLYPVLFALLFFSFFLAEAQIPFGVSAREIVVTNYVDVDITTGYSKSEGKLAEYEYKAGNRIGVHIDRIGYELRFWNVGALGGTSGMLWWKKTYADATLTIHCSIDKPGFVVGEPREDKVFMKGNQFYPLEPATNPPDIEDVVYSLTFTGGPGGNFTEKQPFRDGDQLQARMPGTNILFYYKGKPHKVDRYQIGLTELFENPMPFPVHEFSEWGNKEESDLVDSGTRFNSLSGQVEVRHESEANGWKSAQLDMVLYVDDHIRTGEESSCILSFADMSTFVMKEETEICLNSPPSKNNKLKLVGGKVMANIRKMIKDGSMEIDMSQAVAGIKGTTFVLESSAGASSLKVIEGTVNFTSKADGKVVQVSDGQMSSADAKGVSLPQAVDLSAEKTEWEHDKSMAAQNPVKQVSKQIPKPEPAKSGKQGFPLTWFIIPFLILVLVPGIWLILRKRKQRTPVSSQITASPVLPLSPPSNLPLSPSPSPPISPLPAPPISPSPKFCPQCGSPFKPKTKFCGQCGFKTT
jgi:hypothetical protein